MQQQRNVCVGDQYFAVDQWDGCTNILASPDDVICIVIGNKENSEHEVHCYHAETPYNESHWVIGVSTSKYNVFVQPIDLLRFFQCHQHGNWVSHQCDKTFAVLRQLFTSKISDEIDSIWEFVEQGQLRDVQILGTLYYLIEDIYQPKSLLDLIQHTTTVNLTPIIQKHKQKLQNLERDTAEALEILQNINIIKAIGIRYTWKILARLSNKIMDIYEDEMYPNVKSSFGLLTDIIQVKAKISLFYMHLRGIYVEKNDLINLIHETTGKIREHTEELLKILPYSRNLFQVGIDGDFVTDEDGVPCMNRVRLGEILYCIQSEFLQDDESFESILVMDNFKKSYNNVNIRQWECYRKRHPFLDLWIDFERLKSHLEYLKGLKNYAPDLHPTWHYFQKNGRASCAQPNIQITPRDPEFRKLFKAREGYSFLVVDYKYIELCTFAAISEFKFDYSMLAKVIRGNTDPHCYTASIFSNLTMAQFMQLRENDPIEYAKQRTLAKFMNFSILSGVGVKKLQEQIQISQETSISGEAVREFKKKLVTQVYPEMNLYQYTDKVNIWIRNLGCSRQQFMQKCVFPKSSSFSKKHEKQIVRILRGRNYNGHIKWEKQFWKALVNINRNSNLVNVLQTAFSKNKGGAKVFNALSSYSICTLTGRLRRNVNWMIHNNSGFSGLAADGAKLALWNLEYVGYRTVGFIHDEFIIEVPKDDKNGIDLALEILCESMAEVVKTVPISCEYGIHPSWEIPNKKFEKT